MARSEQQNRTPLIDPEDWMLESDSDESDDLEEAVIRKRSSIDPHKRRRIEMMQEERALQKALREVFDEDD